MSCNCSCAGNQTVVPAVPAADSPTDRADLGSATGVVQATAGLLIAVSVITLIVIYVRKTDSNLRKYSVGVCVVSCTSCALTFAASLLWAEDDITVTSYFDDDDVLMTCSLAERAKKVSGVERAGCGSCTVRVWLTVLAITCMWGCVWLKLLRGRAMSEAKSSGRRYSRLASARSLVPLLLPLIAVQCLGLGIFSLADPPSLDHPEYQHEEYSTKVRRPLRPATCCFDWDFPMRRLFLSRNIEGATDAGRRTGCATPPATRSSGPLRGRRGARRCCTCCASPAAHSA
jgi:hypothetical protein